MSAFERLLEPGCTESPVCRCGREMEVARIEQLPEGTDADLRVYHCPTCHHGLRRDICASQRYGSGRDRRPASKSAGRCRQGRNSSMGDSGSLCAYFRLRLESHSSPVLWSLTKE